MRRTAGLLITTFPHLTVTKGLLIEITHIKRAFSVGFWKWVWGWEPEEESPVRALSPSFWCTWLLQSICKQGLNMDIYSAKTTMKVDLNLIAFAKLKNLCCWIPRPFYLTRSFWRCVFNCEPAYLWRLRLKQCWAGAEVCFKNSKNQSGHVFLQKSFVTNVIIWKCIRCSEGKLTFLYQPDRKSVV